MIPFWKHQEQGRHLRQVSEEDQSVANSFHPLRTVMGITEIYGSKNVSVVE